MWINYDSSLPANLSSRGHLHPPSFLNVRGILDLYPKSRFNNSTPYRRAVLLVLNAGFWFEGLQARWRRNQANSTTLEHSKLIHIITYVIRVRKAADLRIIQDQWNEKSDNASVMIRYGLPSFRARHIRSQSRLDCEVQDQGTWTNLSSSNHQLSQFINCPGPDRTGTDVHPVWQCAQCRPDHWQNWSSNASSQSGCSALGTT